MGNRYAFINYLGEEKKHEKVNTGTGIMNEMDGEMSMESREIKKRCEIISEESFDMDAYSFG
ncbi:MAG: hypothetical protein QF682_01065 [Candidatus Thermoplasmatota archaeon]|jgi:hypothetical protein|nr:hypothetical protein [Candidatus Thermoplasmatota archaeon]